MKADKILFIDTETGGIDPSRDSLLSMALLVWSEGEMGASIEILINDGVLHVTEEALRINGIDLGVHVKEALSPEGAMEVFSAFVGKYFGEEEKIVLGGHNISFDVNFLNVFLTKYGPQWKGRISHRHVDTSSILFYLYLTGKIKRKIVSSQDAFDYFGIIVDGRHTALGDVKATAQLFSRLVGILYEEGESGRNVSSDQPDPLANKNG